MFAATSSAWMSAASSHYECWSRVAEKRGATRAGQKLSWLCLYPVLELGFDVGVWVMIPYGVFSCGEALPVFFCAFAYLVYTSSSQPRLRNCSDLECSVPPAALCDVSCPSPLMCLMPRWASTTRSRIESASVVCCIFRLFDLPLDPLHRAQRSVR